MLRIGTFEVLRPRSLDEALAMRSEYTRALWIAGGSDLVPKLKRAQFAPDAVISLAEIDGLEGVSRRDDTVRIGALTRLSALERAPEIAALTVLREATGVIATPIIRSMGTVGGNLLQDTRCRYYDRGSFWRESLGSCLKIDAEVCRVATGGNRCFATLCSDLAPALAVLDATATVVGEKGARTVRVEELYSNDGAAPFTLDGDVLMHVDVLAHERFSRYRKFRIRDSFDFPEVGVAVAIEEHKAQLRVSVAVTAVAPSIPVFRENVSRDGLSQVEDTVYAAIKPMDTLFLPPAHRKSVARNMLRRIFDEFRATG
ncbi:MAG TPA: FAD binding domain-containing protein [Candidatus Krumholzibacteria bacterium]|nr:FAD binding domain-containing protein [Candidatus Krumholzibacteria bacterium]